jgi:hypothetical protein
MKILKKQSCEFHKIMDTQAETEIDPEDTLMDLMMEIYGKT